MAILAKTAILVVLASHFRAIESQGGHADKKSQLGSCLNQRDGATHGGVPFRSTTAPAENQITTREYVTIKDADVR